MNHNGSTGTNSNPFHPKLADSCFCRRRMLPSPCHAATAEIRCKRPAALLRAPPDRVFHASTCRWEPSRSYKCSSCFRLGAGPQMPAERDPSAKTWRIPTSARQEGGSSLVHLDDPQSPRRRTTLFRARRRPTNAYVPLEHARRQEVVCTRRVLSPEKGWFIRDSCHHDSRICPPHKQMFTTKLYEAPFHAPPCLLGFSAFRESLLTVEWCLKVEMVQAMR